MLSVKFRIRRNHFRLHPYSKFQPQLIHLINKMFQTALDLVFIYKPVSKTCGVIISMSKPAIIHDQHLYSMFCRTLCYRKELIGIKVKICSLPVVDEDRSLLVKISAPYHVASVKIMKISSHLSKSIMAVCKHNLRRCKRLSRREPPLKSL